MSEPLATSAAALSARVWRRRGRCAVLAALLVTAVEVLAPTLRAPLFMDDFVHLLLIEGPAPSLRELHFNTYGVTALPRDAIRWALPWWTSDDFEFNYFRPASTAFLALDYQLWGRTSWGYHLSSLLAHLLAVVLVHRLLRTFGVGREGAAAGAAIFAFHPGNIAAVYWVSNRSDLVAVSVMIGALLAFRAAGRARGVRRHVLHLATVALAMVGMLTKEIVCALPGLFVLHEILGLADPVNERRIAVPWRDTRWLRALPFLGLALAYVAWYAGQGFGLRSGYAPVTLAMPFGEKLAFAAKSAVLAAASLTTYLPPSLRRHERLLVMPSLVAAGLFIAALVGAVVVALRSRGTRSLRLFALAWVVLAALPTLGFLPSARYFYVASVGWALLAGSGVDSLWRTISSRTLRMALASSVFGYAFVVPAAADLWLVRRVDTEFRTGFEGLVDAYRSAIGPVRADDVIVLVNTPSRTTASGIAAAFRFLTPGVAAQVEVLTNFDEPPAMVAEDERTLLVTAPPGHRFFEAPVDWIYLTRRDFHVGQVFHAPHFDATIAAMDGAEVAAMRFRTRVPLADPRWVPVYFAGPEHVLARCSFPEHAP